MSNVKEIESALTGLPLDDLQAVRDWLVDLIEEQLDVSDEFKAKIQRAKRELLDTLPFPSMDVSDKEVDRREKELESAEVAPISHDEFVRRVQQERRR